MKTKPVLEPLLVRALQCEPVQRVPVWLMRQAGRYLPEYRKLRQEHSFEELIKSPELATRVTLQPVERFDLDGAIIFFDILYLFEALGVNVTFDDSGPKVQSPFTSGKLDTSATRMSFEPGMFTHLAESLEMARKKLAREKALIGFVGGPFTLFSYLMPCVGESALLQARRLLLEQPGTGKEILATIAEVAGALAELQVKAGAQVIQVFDTWAGILPGDMFPEFAAPFIDIVLDRINNLGVPSIYFARNTTHLLGELKKLKASAISLDWTVDLKIASQVLGPEKALQGNLDPAVLLCGNNVIQDRVYKALRQGGESRGFVFNLGHGVPPQADPGKIELLVDTVRKGPT
ncbi:MAG: uroporphyrinogen decarboxylase [Deltaproteobacteria bacterium]|nr:uroporphyrinogen decarboxylase [Deltaproteobacteria bacterium]